MKPRREFGELSPLSSASPLARTRAFLLLFFFATSTRCTLWVEGTLQGLVHPGISGTALGLLPGLCLLSSSRDWRKCRFIALYGRDPCQEDWATLEPKVCGNPLCCSFPICVFVHSISCWFGNYPLHFA